MDINQSSLSRFKTNKPGIARTSSEAKSISEYSKTRETSSSSSIQSLKQLDLKEGQIIKGQIIDHRYNEVKIELDPGKQVITAKLSGDVPVSIGQDAQFQVTEEGSERLVLKYIPSDTAAPTDITIQKALNASSLPMTERNKAIVEELLTKRMPIDKQTLQTLVKLSYTSREASPLTLVLMLKNNIPMTQANIKQFEAYQNGTHQLLNDIRSISKNIAELLKQPGEIAPTVQANPSNISTNLSNVSNEVPLNNVPSVQSNVTGQSNVVEQNNVSGQSNISEQNNVSGQGNISEQNNISGQSNVSGQSNISSQGTIPSQTTSSELGLQTAMPATMQEQLKEVIQINEKLINILYSNSDKPSIEITSSTPLNNFPRQEELSLLGKVIEQRITENTALAEVIPPEIMQQIGNGTLSDVLNPIERTTLLDYFAAFPDTENIKSQIGEGTASMQKALNYVKETLTQVTGTTAGEVLRSPEYLKLLEGAFLQKWTFTPQKMASKTSVSALFQSLQKDLDKLSTLQKINNESFDIPRFHEPVKNIQENLQFIRDLNNVFTYLQLPIQLKDREVHSDLYVLTKKKALNGTSGNLSVLLHLDMTSLGSLNVHIQMDHNKIQANFYIEDAKAGHLISENLPSLADVLQKKGYSLQAEVKDNYKKPDFSKDFIEENSQDNFIQQYTFDIRT